MGGASARRLERGVSSPRPEPPAATKEADSFGVLSFDGRIQSTPRHAVGLLGASEPPGFSGRRLTSCLCK